MPARVPVPDAVIDAKLGRGLSYPELMTELKDDGYVNSPRLKDHVVKRQYLFFRDEIGQILAESATDQKPFKSNSHRLILLRLQGYTGERDQRLQNQRLCGFDAR